MNGNFTFKVLLISMIIFIFLSSFGFQSYFSRKIINDNFEIIQERHAVKSTFDRIRGESQDTMALEGVRNYAEIGTTAQVDFVSSTGNSNSETYNNQTNITVRPNISSDTILLIDIEVVGTHHKKPPEVSISLRDPSNNTIYDNTVSETTNISHEITGVYGEYRLRVQTKFANASIDINWQEIAEKTVDITVNDRYTKRLIIDGTSGKPYVSSWE